MLYGHIDIQISKGVCTITGQFLEDHKNEEDQESSH